MLTELTHSVILPRHDPNHPSSPVYAQFYYEYFGGNFYKQFDVNAI
jgi:hypothetical protein